MVESFINDDCTGTIVLRPNQSWTWRYNLYLLYTLLAVSLLMGGFFVYVGAWVILPYSLLELSVLTACMYYCLKRAQRQEVIRVTEEHVTVEQGRKNQKNLINSSDSGRNLWLSLPTIHGAPAMYRSNHTERSLSWDVF